VIAAERATTVVESSHSVANVVDRWLVVNTKVTVSHRAIQQVVDVMVLRVLFPKAENAKLLTDPILREVRASCLHIRSEMDDHTTSAPENHHQSLTNTQSKYIKAR